MGEVGILKGTFARKVIGLMRLAEEHSMPGWLAAPDRAHRGPQRSTAH